MTPRKNESKHKLPKYDYLYQFPDRPGIYYQRWSSEKQDTFTYSTGFDDPRQASKIGKEKYDDWLGTAVSPHGYRLIRDFGRPILASKESNKGGKQGATYRSTALAIKHINEAFGHLRPDQITPIRWKLYDAAERKRVYHREGKKDPKTGKREQIPYCRTTTNHMRQILLEILRLANQEGLLRVVPELKNFDRDPAPPRYISKDRMLRIIRKAGRRGRSTKLLAFIMWKQGPRPAEALQYRWDMIHWDEGPTGTLHIPGAITKTTRSRVIPLNSSVSRLLRWLEPRAESPYLFPSPGKPGKHQSAYKTGWGSACRRAGFDFEPYNCRDTFITNCLKRGLSTTFIGKYCDNSPEMIHRRYAVALQESLSEVAG